MATTTTTEFDESDAPDHQRYWLLGGSGLLAIVVVAFMTARGQTKTEAQPRATVSDHYELVQPSWGDVKLPPPAPPADADADPKAKELATRLQNMDVAIKGR
jgi:hypothetical protein